jgi:hypothetical protein
MMGMVHALFSNIWLCYCSRAGQRGVNDAGALLYLEECWLECCIALPGGLLGHLGLVGSDAGGYLC